jgi:hypothetical protein
MLGMLDALPGPPVNPAKLSASITISQLTH